MNTSISFKKNWFITSIEGKLEDNYEVDGKNVLSEGSYGKVIKAKHKIIG